ncbi:MAG TPA: tRNA (guanosine(46)-N7)-methyltransferase TrmB, partial [Allocoleopsis sp.]
MGTLTEIRTAIFCTDNLEEDRELVVRVRQHVNPLSQKYQQPVVPPAWEKLYAELSQPLHLDIGCGRGYFLLSMAQQEPNWNYLGLEIREPLVMQANLLRTEMELTNVHYIFCNISNSLRGLLASLPVNSLQRVTIQFPDPWFKKRHQKRRMIQPAVVEILSDYLVSGGIVFVQSDVEAVATDICNQFACHAAFERQNEGWLPENPLAVPTERERST